MLIFTSLFFSALLGENLEAAEKPSKLSKSSNSEKTETQKPIKRIDTMIAVFDLEARGKVDKDISYPLSESIRREVFKSGKWELIDRGNMDKMLGEQKFQLSGCVTGQCIVEAGQMLGVGKIVAGSVSLIGKTYYLSLSLINAETGKIEAQSEDKCKCELDELIDSSKRLVKKLMGEKDPVTTMTPSSESEGYKGVVQNLINYKTVQINFTDKNGDGVKSYVLGPKYRVEDYLLPGNYYTVTIVDGKQQGDKKEFTSGPRLFKFFGKDYHWYVYYQE